MLKRTSWFVLEVLPCLLSALIAAVIVPGLLYSQAHETKTTITPSVPGLEMSLRDHATLAPDEVLSDPSAKTAERKVAYR